jgi:hypothetical protein
MLHVEIKLLKLQEVNHAVHVDPGKSTCGASCKNSSYQMPLNYCLVALQAQSWSNRFTRKNKKF